VYNPVAVCSLVGKFLNVSINFSLSFAITYTQSTGFYSDNNGWCAQENACTNTGTPMCPIVSVRNGISLTTCAIWFETLSAVVNGLCQPIISWAAGGPGVCTATSH